ncbi:MAG: hypothetical protein GEU73_07760 [Chloroflexi bacterium]|nr:hypothetical protein [Chloroflexota bacterium]
MMAAESSPEIVESAELVPAHAAALLPGDPTAQAEHAVLIGRTLADMADNNGWAVTINKRRYLMAEGWQFVGSQLGLVPGTEWTRRLTKAADGVDGWEARTVITHLASGQQVGAGESMCDRSESRWKTADEYAIRSMASTRSVSRAFRNFLGWAATAGGFSATPAEEVQPEGFEPERRLGSDSTAEACPVCGAGMRYTPPGQSKAGNPLSGRWWCIAGPQCPAESGKYGATVWQDDSDESWESALTRFLVDHPEHRPDDQKAMTRDVREGRLGPDGLRRIADEVAATVGVVADQDPQGKALVEAAVKAAIGVLVARSEIEASPDGPIAAAMNAPYTIHDPLVAEACDQATDALADNDHEGGP